MNVPRPAAWTALSLVALGALGLLADTGLSMRAEHRLAQEIHSAGVSPTVDYVGTVLTPQLLGAKLSGVRITARDVELQPYGLVTLTNEAGGITMSPDEILSGAVFDHPAATIRNEVRLDSLSLGNILGISDLTVRNLDDNSPLGGWEDAVVVSTATPPAEAIVHLRITNEGVVGQPTRLLTAADPDALTATEQEELERFAFRIAHADLPLPQRATRIFGSGGNITIQSERFSTTVQRADLLTWPQ